VLFRHDFARRWLAAGAHRHRVNLHPVELQRSGAILVPVRQDETKTHLIADPPHGRLGDARRHQVERRERRSLLTAGAHQPAERYQHQAMRPPAAVHQRT
jgi:hypothetical protein